MSKMNFKNEKKNYFDTFSSKKYFEKQPLPFFQTSPQFYVNCKKVMVCLVAPACETNR